MNRYGKFLFSLVLGCTILAFGLSTYAANTPKLYQVELIIFQRLPPPPPATDLWASNPVQPNLGNAIKLHIGGNSQDYQLLPETDFKLMPEARALNRSHQYRMILHTAWLQDISNTAQPIQISGGRAYNTYGEPLSSTYSSMPAAYWEVNGSLSISKARYFDIKTRLFFTEPVHQYASYARQAEPQPINTSTPLISFRMLQSRRMKSNELDYFDHPLFGMLIKIVPYKG